MIPIHKIWKVKVVFWYFIAHDVDIISKEHHPFVLSLVDIYIINAGIYSVFDNCDFY